MQHHILGSHLPAGALPYLFLKLLSRARSAAKAATCSRLVRSRLSGSQTLAETAGWESSVRAINGSNLRNDRLGGRGLDRLASFIEPQA